MSLAKLIEEKRREKNKKEKNKKTKNIAVGATVGILAGLAGGVLFAPKAGKETREALKESANDLSVTAKEKTIEVKNKVSQYLKDKKDEKVRLAAAIKEDNRTATIEDVML
ncbi:MAG: YtxH domain-containing protein [Clostridium sp.]